MSTDVEIPTPSSFERVMGMQHTAFATIFDMFKEITSANEKLHRRLNELASSRENDFLQMEEMRKEIKVSAVFLGMGGGGHGAPAQ